MDETPARPLRVELRVAGDVGPLVGALFGDASYVVEPTTTTVVSVVADDAELQELCHRVRDAGVELVALRRLDGPDLPDAVADPTRDG